MPSKDKYACKCCGKNLIEDSLVSLVTSIEQQAGCSLTVNSGYRCSNHNATVGGKSNSMHVVGKAADITCGNLSKLKKTCKNMWSANKIGGLGIYSTFVHVDKGRHRKW